MTYLDENGIKNALAKHLMEYRGYSEKKATLAVSDFPDPYNLPYLDEEYVDDETIDDEEYEKYASVVDLRKCGFVGTPIFRFYTYYAIEDIPNQTVGEYLAAKKLFQTEDLDEDDFSSDESEFRPVIFY